MPYLHRVLTSILHRLSGCGFTTSSCATHPLHNIVVRGRLLPRFPQFFQRNDRATIPSYMLAKFESKLSKVRSRQSLRHHHIESCNSIHCDIVEGVLRRNRGSREDESEDDHEFIRSMRSFVINQSSQREILLGCINNSTVQQTLFAR